MGRISEGIRSSPLRGFQRSGWRNGCKILVIGAKDGDVLEGISEPMTTATEEEKKEFAPKKVRITIIKLEEAALCPRSNDEFAKKVGAQDVARMRSHGRSDFEQTSG